MSTTIGTGRLGLRPLGVVPDPWYAGEGRLFRATRQDWSSRDHH